MRKDFVDFSAESFIAVFKLGSKDFTIGITNKPIAATSAVEFSLKKVRKGSSPLMTNSWKASTISSISFVN